MNRSVTVQTKLQFSPHVRVTLDEYPLEISLDCSQCSRARRTVKMSTTGSPLPTTMPSGWVFVDDNEGHSAVCFSVRHPFPAGLTECLVSQSEPPEITIRLQYQFEPFVDTKYGDEASGQSTWCRVHFNVLCPVCSVSRRMSTQSNDVRPYTETCTCGFVLYTNTEAPQIVTALLDENIAME